jgi:hypothetical protein
VGVLSRRPLQRLDETEQGGERRAQFVARVGDEIDPHPLDPTRLAEIVQRQDHGRLDLRPLHRIDVEFEIAFDRHALKPGRPFRAARGASPRHCVKDVGGAQAARKQIVRAQRRKQSLRGRIDGDDPVRRADNDDGFGQRVDQSADDHPVARRLNVFHDPPMILSLRCGATKK